MLFGTVSEWRIRNTLSARTRKTGDTNLVQNNTSPCVITSVSIYLGVCRYGLKLEQLWYKRGWVSKRSGTSESRETHSRAPGSIIPSKLVSCGSCLQISHERWDVSIASPIEMAKMGDAQGGWKPTACNKTQIRCNAFTYRKQYPDTAGCILNRH